MNKTIWILTIAGSNKDIYYEHLETATECNKLKDYKIVRIAPGMYDFVDDTGHIFYTIWKEDLY